MLGVSLSATPSQLKEHFMPPAPAAAPPEPTQGFTLESAGAAILELDAIAAERKKITAALQKEADAVNQAMATFQANKARTQNRLTQLDARMHDCERARGQILSHRQRPADERQLQERSVELLKRVGELRSRHRVFASEMALPEKSKAFADVEDLTSQVAEFQARVRNENEGAHPGMSYAARKLRELLPSLDHAQAELERYRQNYRQWSEIEEARQQAAEARAQLEQLQRERDAAAIDEAVTAAKAAAKK